MTYKYDNENIQNLPSLLDYYLLKLGEIKFQMKELDNYVNNQGCAIVQLVLKFSEFNVLLSNTEDKLIEIRKMCLGNNKFKLRDEEE